MPAIAHLESGHYRIPLPVVLTDSTHGEMKAFELNTIRVRDADGADSVRHTECCATCCARHYGKGLPVM